MAAHPAVDRWVAVAVLTASFTAPSCGAAQKPSSQERKMTAAESVIDHYRHGGEFRPQTPGFSSGPSLIPHELDILAAALPDESTHVREQIVRLLADLGRRADPLFARGAAILREPRVLAALTGPALSRNDSARDAALSLLHEFAPASALAPYAAALVADFEKFPSAASFLVLAKAKPPQARALVRRIAVMPRWMNDVNGRIARAAFGDQAAEKFFTEPLASTQDAREFAALARQTGWIGTPAALRALADQLRTSLVYEIPGSERRSARLDVIAALSFNFPEEPVLFPNNITSEQSYEAAERFCQQRFGTQWSKPRPPFLTYQPFPI